MQTVRRGRSRTGLSAATEAAAGGPGRAARRVLQTSSRHSLSLSSRKATGPQARKGKNHPRPAQPTHGVPASTSQHAPLPSESGIARNRPMTGLALAWGASATSQKRVERVRTLPLSHPYGTPEFGTGQQAALATSPSGVRRQKRAVPPAHPSSGPSPAEQGTSVARGR